MSDIVTKPKYDEDHCPYCGAELEFSGSEESSDFHSRFCDCSCPSCKRHYTADYVLRFMGFTCSETSEFFDADEGVAS